MMVKSMSFCLSTGGMVSFYLLFDYSRRVYAATVGFYRCIFFRILFCTFYAAFIAEFSRFTLLKNTKLYLYIVVPTLEHWVNWDEF